MTEQQQSFSCPWCVDGTIVETGILCITCSDSRAKFHNLPKAWNRAYRVHQPDSNFSYRRSQVFCLSCKWESSKIASIDAYVDGSSMRGLTDFDRGFLAGAFRNHNCIKKDT